MKRNNKNSNNSSKVKKVIEEMQSKMTDPNGSYTGVPENPYEKPTQDADDL